MLIADAGGGSVRAVATPPAVSPAQQAPANSGASDAAARAAELERQLEALLEKLREAQRQAEEARKRAIEAQKKADEAKAQAEALAAQRTKSQADADAAKKAQQDYQLQDARAKQASADANLKDKDVSLLRAQVTEKREQKKSPDGQASAATTQKVKDAQGERDGAQKTSDLSNLYADSQEKESKAQDAQAVVQQLAPNRADPIGDFSPQESKALSDARSNAATLRADADAAHSKFASAVGAQADSQFYGAPAPVATPVVAPGTQPVVFANDPLHSPLTQLLQVSPQVTVKQAPPGNPPLSLTLASLPYGTSFGSTLAPSATLPGTPLSATTPFAAFLKKPEPVVTPQVKKTLSDIADGKSVDQIASDRHLRADQVVAEAGAAGVKISPSAPGSGVQATTIQRGDASLTYTHDTQHDTFTVKGSFVDASAPGGKRTIQATQDGNGRYSQTTHDAKTGDTVTHTVDTQAGTRTDSVVDKNGLRTDTTTSLTGAQVTRPVGDYEGYLDVAKAAGLSPEQLLALNPDVDYGKALKPGQQMVVTGVPTTVKTFNKDGTTLEKTTASDGSLQVVATSASGRRTVLIGVPDAKDGPGEAARKAIFEGKKSVAYVANSQGLTEDQVLASLPPGTVEVTKPTADNGEVETRTLYDPTTNRVVVETHDWQHDTVGRQDIDDKTVFKVNQLDPDTNKPEVAKVAGGLGYLQKQSDDQAARADSYGQQISDLDNTIRLYRHMGEPTTDLSAQRKQLVATQTTAQGQVRIASTQATAALTKRQQVIVDQQALVAYQNLAYARPGSKDQTDAAQVFNDKFALLDNIDRIVDSANKDVGLSKAGLDQQQAQDAKTAADDKLQTEFEKWKDDVWMWQGIDKDIAKKMKAEGQTPAIRTFSDPQQAHDVAWESFVDQQKDIDKYGDDGLPAEERPARDAWVQRNQASDAALKAEVRYDDASMASDDANNHVTQGDLDRLQQQKDAWTKANPDAYSETFAKQGDLDALKDTVTKGTVDALQLGADKKHTQYLQTVSAPDRADPDALKKAEDKYAQDNQEADGQLGRQIAKLQNAGTDDKAKTATDYIKQWAVRNPELQKQLDALGDTNAQGSVRAAEYRQAQRDKLLSASDQGKQLQAAIQTTYDVQGQLMKLADQDDARVQKDLDGINKGIDGHTFVRDAWGAMFGDSADDAKNYAQDELGKAQQMRDDLVSGKISVADYASQENSFMDGYDAKAGQLAQRVQDSDGTWSVVDDAVRTTVTAAAGIAATIASGGNVAVGFGVAMGVSELWDTTGDIVAAAQGRDIYADGHTSLLTLDYKMETGTASWNDIKFTLKDEAIDAASNAVTATGVGAGIETSAALTAKLVAKETLNVGGRAVLKVGGEDGLNIAGRAVVGARAAVASQAIDGAGRVGVETLHVGLDGELGTDQGNQRITSTIVSSAAGLLTAPLTGAVSGAIPLEMKVPGAGIGAQFVNDAVAGLGTSDLISLANDGRHMNTGEFIAASLQVIPGTLNNVAVHPAIAARARKAAQAEASSATLVTPPQVDDAGAHHVVVTNVALSDLLSDAQMPMLAPDTLEPGGRLELHIPLDPQKTAAADSDGAVPHEGDEPQATQDQWNDQAAAIQARLVRAGYEEVEVIRNAMPDAEHPEIVVHATKPLGERVPDGVVPLLPQPLPADSAHPDGPDAQDAAQSGKAPPSQDGATQVNAPPRKSGLILPGGVANDTFLTVPDNATVYYIDKFNRMAQIAVDDPRVAEALERAQQSRARLLALPSHEQGLDIDSVRAWGERLGMAPTDLRVVDPETLRQHSEKAGRGAEPLFGSRGVYLDRDGVALVARDPLEEQLLGKAPILRTAAHELAHGNENKRSVFVLRDAEDPTTSKASYDIEPTPGLLRFDAGRQRPAGLALEEAYAEHKAQQFDDSRYGPRKPGRSFADELGRYQPEGGQGRDHGAATAVTLDALLRMDPTIEGLMEHSRFSDAAHQELVSVLGGKLDAFYDYRGEDLALPAHLEWAEQVHNAVQNNTAMRRQADAGPLPTGPLVLSSRPVQRAAGGGDDGLPVKPSAFGTGGDWMAAALHLERTVAQQRKAGQVDQLPPGMVLSDADKAVTQALMRDPTAGSDECFVVSGRKPSKGIFAGDDVRAKPKDVFETFDKALEAVSGRHDGAWVYRVAPEGGIQEMTAAGKARSHNILGAFFVDKDKSVFPVGIANPQFDRWGLTPTVPSVGRAHVYNAALTMPVGRPAEGIFRQGGIEEGADAATAAIDRAVAEGRKPAVMIAAGYSSERGRAETSGPGGAAVAGKAARLYADQTHGVDTKITYVVAGRSQRKVLTAALDALDEHKGEHYDIVSFNARGKRAEWRSSALLKRHQPDLLMGFDVPGRTDKGEYHDSHGRAIGYRTAARDQLFIDVTRNDNITSIAGFDLGNEVGGGHPDVHARVQPAPNGTRIASIVTADVAMTGGRTNWVGYAFGTEVLRRAGALSAVPDEKTVRNMVIAMMKAGGVDSETDSHVPFRTDARGRISGVGGMSPNVEAAVAAMLRVRAQKVQVAPGIDLRGVRLRLGVFDSGSGGIIAAAEIKRVVEETTGARVDLVMVGDHGAGTYGPKPKTEIADYTRAGLETLDKVGVDLIVMACNTACTSGKPEYARGISAPVIDLIDSTRGFHQGLVNRGERVVAFSTEASATLPLPGTDLIGVYRDKDVLPVGGTDDGFDVASIVNQYMADPMNTPMRARMQGAADHYADKILAAKPDVTTVSWCCTHYPELEPFFTKSLQDRGRSEVKMINPMTHQAMKAIEVARQLPPGTGAGPSRAIGITTAVADKQKAIEGGLHPKRAEVDQEEVRNTLRIALQRDDVTFVPLDRLGADVDVDAARNVLDKDEAGDPIDALQAFDPSGRGFPIHVPGGAYAAAKTLNDAQRVVVVAGFPIRTAGGHMAPESDSTKGAAVLASALDKLGKNTTCITMKSNVKPLKAALAVLGRGDIEVKEFGHKIGSQATSEALKMLQDLDPHALVSVEAPGRDGQGDYWSSTGERITDHVTALDEFFYAARTLNAGRAEGAPKISQVAILDVGNEVGGGSVDKRVRRAPDGQRIASEVTADQLVTAGVGSWGADATVAALEVLQGNHGNHDLLPSTAQVPRVIRAITAAGGVDSQSRTAIDDAAGYSPTVHVGMTELFRQAALEVRADRAASAAAPAGKSSTAKPTTPAPAEPQSAAFRGDEWREVHARLTNGGFGNDSVYVYHLKDQPDLYADPAANVDLTLDQIDGSGRVAAGTQTVRWYGNSTPGKGVGGLMPRREMGARFGLEPKADKQTIYRIKNRKTREITRQPDKPTAEQRKDPNLLIRATTGRPPREASPQPSNDWFVVSNQSPVRIDAVNGLRGVPRGDSSFTLPSLENKPKLPTGWSVGKVIRKQITLGLVAAVGIATANAISPIDIGNDVPTGVVGLPRNPISVTTPFQHVDPGFHAAPEAFSVPADVTLGMARFQQNNADQLARAPGHDPAAAKSLQTTADNAWGAFSAEMVKAIRDDVQHGHNAVASANGLRAQLLASNRFDVHSDNAIRDALRDSGLLQGTTADVQAQMDYGQLVATHPALVNDESRDLAKQDPAAFAAATLVEIGPDSGAYDTAVSNNAAMLGRLHSEEIVKERLADGDLAGANKEAGLRLDASRSPAERAKAAAALVPLFQDERTRALKLLAGAQMQDVGDYLAQYRDAPPEVAQPVAQGTLDLLQKNLPRASDDLASMSQFEHLVEGLSTVAEAADARSPTSAFSERFTAELLQGRFAGRPEFVASLQRGIASAVELGSVKLPVELANALQSQGNGDLRDTVVAGIDKGVQAQDAHLGEAMANLRGTGGYNATGASLAFYVAHFSDGTPQGAADAIAQYRRVNPAVADKVDVATRVVGDWGRTLANTQESLNGLRLNPKENGAEQGLEGTLGTVYNKSDVQLAISQSPQLRQELLSRTAQGVVDPRTMVEYLANPVMFITRHLSGTTRMVWSMVADAQFNGMVADPTNYAKRWDAFKVKTERMANVLGLNPDEVREGTSLVDEYVGKVSAVDPNLPDAARIDEYARLGGELDSKLQKLTGVTAKTINNVTNANTAFGQTLRWAANAGFVTHNISTELTNFRPLANGVQDYARWYHRIYAPTQAFFLAKPYTTLQAEGSLAGNRVIDGGAADIEAKMAWKYGFGLGTAGVGVADLSLALGQAKTVPVWVTYTNVGMGVGGVVDGGVGLINVTGAALSRAGAVEAGSLLAIPAEAGTIGGLGVAVFTGIKQFYNIAHHYDQVDAREAQRDPALHNALLDAGFSSDQTVAMLDCTHEGVSPMVAWNALMKSTGKTTAEGLQLLHSRLGKAGPQGIPTNDWISVMHGLTDGYMNDNDGSFPASDRDADQAGQKFIVQIPGRPGETTTMSKVVLPKSIAGLESYAQKQWDLYV